MSSDFSFTKSLRLLNAHDYKNVFDNNEWKVSNQYFLMLVKSNPDNHPRIGLIIAKKNVKLAVQRNRMKRVIRDSFRHQQHQLPAVDIVIMVRKGIDSLDNQEVHSMLNKLWKKLDNKVNNKPKSWKSSRFFISGL